MTFVAFFRNLNLGHHGSPNRTQLESAFTDAGALHVRCFQTNGTVVFTADDPATAITATLESLRDFCGYDDCAFIRSTKHIGILLDRLPPPESSPDTYRETISFFDTDHIASHAHASTKDPLVALIGLYPDYAHASIGKVGNRVGNITRHLETLLKVPVTTRTRGTLERLLSATDRRLPSRPAKWASARTTQHHRGSSTSANSLTTREETAC